MGEKEEQSTAIHISVPSYFRKVKKQNNISHETTSNQNSFFKKKEMFKAIPKYFKKKKSYRSLDICVSSSRSGVGKVWPEGSGQPLVS